VAINIAAVFAAGTSKRYFNPNDFSFFYDLKPWAAGRRLILSYVSECQTIE
jgi:hypothetical protein